MARRTKLTAEIVVETNGAQFEHDKAVTWAVNQVMNAHRFAHSGEFVAVRITQGDVGRGMVAYGVPQGDTHEIVEDIFDMEENEETT